MPIYLVQCLCPKRHAISASLVEDPDNLSQEQLDGRYGPSMQELLNSAIGSQSSAKLLNSWCPVCKAERETWTIETRMTKFKDMVEAEKAGAGRWRP